MEATHDYDERQEYQSNDLLPSESSVLSTGTTTMTTATATATSSTSISTSISISTAPHEQQPYSSDPFSPNYRHICPWNEEKKADFIATWPLPLRADSFQVYESAEHAEHTRPWDQLLVLLHRRGLEDEFLRIIMGGRDDEVEGEGEKTQTQTQSPFSDERDKEIHEKMRTLLRDAGEGGGRVAGENGGDLAEGEGEVAGFERGDWGGEVVGGGRCSGV